MGNLGSDNSLKWPQISTKWQKDNRQCTLEARYVIIIKNFPVFVPPKSDRKYFHTNSYICAGTVITQDDHRSQLELGRPVTYDASFLGASFSSFGVLHASVFVLGCFAFDTTPARAVNRINTASRLSLSLTLICNLL